MCWKFLKKLRGKSKQSVKLEQFSFEREAPKYDENRNSEIGQRQATKGMEGEATVFKNPAATDSIPAAPEHIPAATKVVPAPPEPVPASPGDKVPNPNLGIGWDDDDITKVFYLFDHGEKGEVKAEDIQTLLHQCFGMYITSKELASFTGEGGADLLTAHTFSNLVRQVFPNDVSSDDVRNAYELFDKTGTGFITREDVREMMKKWSQNPTEEDLDHMMEEVDLDGDGVIDFNEFLGAIVAS